MRGEPFSKRQRFADAVKIWVRESRKTWADVATRVGVPEKRLQGWITRNRFPESGLRQLAAELGLPNNIAELKRTYTVETTAHGRVEPIASNVSEAIKTYMEPQLEVLRDDIAADVKRFLRSMTEHDIFIVWSIDQLPYELTNLGWQAVGNAVAATIYTKKIYAVYIHPTQEALDRLRNDCGLQLPQASSSFESAFNQFIKKLASTEQLKDIETDEPLLKDGKKARLDPQVIAEQVIRVAAPCTAFSSPGHRYVLFVPADNSTGKAAAALGSFPTKNRAALLPLDAKTTSDLYDFFLSCLKSDGPHRKSKIVQFLAPHT